MNGLYSVRRRNWIPLGTLRRFARKAIDDEDKGKIPAHVAVFSLLLLPCIAYSAVFYRGMDARKEELEESIRERYGDKVREATKKNEAMADFYQQAIVNAETGAQDDRLMQVLYAGKGEKKRFHPIDRELYGTAQGLEERKRIEEELALEKERRRERRRRRKEKRKAQVQENTEADMKKESNNQAPDGKRGVEMTQTVAIVSFAALAATIGFFLGGGSRR